MVDFTTSGMVGLRLWDFNIQHAFLQNIAHSSIFSNIFIVLRTLLGVYMYQSRSLRI